MPPLTVSLVTPGVFVCEAIIDVVPSPLNVELVVSVIVSVNMPLGASTVLVKLFELLSVVMLVDDTLNDDEPRVICGIACVPPMLPDSPYAAENVV